jgi:hypothetical protein
MQVGIWNEKVTAIQTWMGTKGKADTAGELEKEMMKMMRKFGRCIRFSFCPHPCLYRGDFFVPNTHLHQLEGSMQKTTMMKTTVMMMVVMVQVRMKVVTHSTIHTVCIVRRELKMMTMMMMMTTVMMMMIRMTTTMMTSTRKVLRWTIMTWTKMTEMTDMMT